MSDRRSNAGLMKIRDAQGLVLTCPCGMMCDVYAEYHDEVDWVEYKGKGKKATYSFMGNSSTPPRS